MKVHHSLICLFFFFFSLQDGNTGLVNAQIPVYSGIEGEDVIIQCSFSFVSWGMYFCKGTCEEKVLIYTSADRGQIGRYRIEYNETSEGADVFVTIYDLMKSDSGLYECGLGEPGTYKPVEIIVVDAVLERNPPEEKTFYTRPGGSVVVECSFSRVGYGKYFCRNDCEGKDILVQTTGDKVQKGRYSIESKGQSVYVSITQLNQSDSGRYRCATDRPLSPDQYLMFNIMVTEDLTDLTTPGPDLIPPASPTLAPSVATPTTTAPSFSSEQTVLTPTNNVLLYLAGTLVVVVISGLVLTIICIRRKSKPEGLITRENPDDTKMEMPDYENYPPVPVSSSEDVTYLTLHPATRDLNQIYSTLTHTQHT